MRGGLRHVIFATTSSASAFDVLVIDYDIRAFGGQTQRDASAYAFCRAGHERNLSCQRGFEPFGMPPGRMIETSESSPSPLISIA